jgi:hypothetical protein
MLSLLSLSLVLSILLFAVTTTTVANATDSFCYDQVGDGHHCFDKEKKCKQIQKHDDIAESPCYIK